MPRHRARSVTHGTATHARTRGAGRRLLRVAAGVAALGTAGCGRDAERPQTEGGGTLVIATAGDVDVLVPPLTMTLQGAQVVAQLFDRLAEPDSTLSTADDRRLRPRLARSWSWGADSLSVAFALDPRARWHDGRPVTARDVAFSFALTTDPATASQVAPLLAGVDSITVRDSLTAVAWFARRHARNLFDLTYQLWIVPEHRLRSVPRGQLAASEFARHPVGTGRFRFASRAPGQTVTLVADTANYRGRPGLDQLVWAVSADPGAATRRLVAGEADVWEQLRGDGLAQASRTPSVRTVAYPSMDVGYLAFNVRGATREGERAPLFADRALRRALASAVDRASVVRNVFDTLALATSAPAPRAVGGAPAAAAMGPAYDVAAAGRALDALGWRDADGDGVRERGGRPLRFRLLVPTSSQVRQRLAVLLQAQLAGVGARVDVETLDPGAFAQAMQRGRFDAVINAWHSDPAPAGILQQWGAPGASGRGSANITGYSNPAFDALVDSAAAAGPSPSATALWWRAYATLADDAPAMWLYELRNVAGVHRRIRPAAMRADAWWADLAEWTVAPGQHIARDRIRVRVAAR